MEEHTAGGEVSKADVEPSKAKKQKRCSAKDYDFKIPVFENHADSSRNIIHDHVEHSIRPWCTYVTHVLYCCRSCRIGTVDVLVWS